MHGLYTTFAPTDEAFAKLPKEFVDSLFLPENDERLEDIIKHHIVDGVLAAGKVPGFLSLGVSGVTPISAFGQQINFKADAAGVTVDGAKVLQADIPCANGIIHVIDSVIPPVDSGLLALLRKDDRYSTLVSLLDATGLSLAVASSSQYTIFAPVNEAWKKEPFASLAADPTGENREALYGILARHVITGKVTLRKDDSRLVEVPLSKLSTKDQAYVDEHAPKSAPRQKGSGPIKLHGITWQPEIEDALEQANGGAGGDRPVMWFRVLGKLDDGM